MFLEQRMPLPISLRSSGGPQWNTSIVRVDSGFEQRNEPWAEDLAAWDVGSFVTTHAEMATLLDFFNGVQGRLHGFRFQDPKDYQALNQSLGTGNGVQTTYQLRKAYGSGGYAKVIRKPVQGTVQIRVAGVLQVEGTAYTVTYSTGVVTFLAGHIPTTGQAVAWSGDFDKPARFDIDQLHITYSDLVYATVSVPVVEVRLA